MSEHEKKTVDDAPKASAEKAVVMRKAEGTSGGKMSAVQSAFGGLSGSSGSALPGPIMRKFESSLGADLSSVRVHTGSASANAASAVSAKAFATGNDIHFNSGQYNPSSSSGQELLAHEVAHTVQQSGASGGAQFKLSVSQPGDRYEVEADRAASAMVKGESFRGLSEIGSSYVARRVHQGDKYHESAEKIAKDNEGKVDSMSILSTSSVGDVAAAKREISNINNADSTIMAAANDYTSGIDSGKVGMNASMRLQLENYISAQGHEGTGLGIFKKQYKTLAMDMVRVKNLFQGYINDMGFDSKKLSDSGQGSGKALAEAMVRDTGLDPNSDQLAKDAVADPDKTTSTNHKAMKAAYSAMKTAGGEVTTTQGAVMTASKGVTAASADMAKGLPTTQESKEQAALNECRASLSAIASKVNKVMGAVVGVISGGASGAVSQVTGALAEEMGGSDATKKVTGQTLKDSTELLAPDVGNAVQQLTELAFKPDLERAKAAAMKAEKEDLAAEITSRGAKLDTAKGKLATQLAKHREAAEAYDQARKDFKSATMDAGRTMDNAMGGDSFSLIAAFLAQTAPAVEQCDVVVNVGNRYVTDAKSDVTGSVNVRKAIYSEGFYYKAEKQPYVSRGGERWVITRVAVSLKPPAGKEGQKGSSAIDMVEGEIEIVKSWKKELEQMETVFKHQLGFQENPGG